MVCIWFFSLGLMQMDYGATFKETGGYGQSLLFSRVEPREIYHSGLIIVSATFFILTMLCAYYLSGEKR
jgi:hypothetical protein